MMLNNIHDDRSNDFDARDFDTKARGQELYKYLFPRLNNKLKGLVSNTKDGFEVLRRVVREHDPVTDNTKVALRARFTQLAGNRCANLNATRNLVQEIDKKLAEYIEKTGEEMPAELQSTVLHGAMDDDIARDAVLARVDMSNYTQLKTYVEERYLEQQERKIDVGTRKDKNGTMDSVDDKEEEWWYDDNGLSALKGGKKGWGKKGADGKGAKGRGCQCYRCGGHGHLAAECPTPEGNTAEHICMQCGGKGHFARDHYQDGKGKGKDGGKDGGKGY